jgi:hypothetical protein
MKEEWKKIEGHPKYKVSNKGRVSREYKRSIRILKGSIQHGFTTIPLSNKCHMTTKRTHILVWAAFGNGTSTNGRKFLVSHIDGNKQNNRIDNLELLSMNQTIAKAFRNRELPTGVFQVSPGRYIAHIRHDSKSYHLGTFDTPDEASSAYQSKLKEFGR